MFDGMSHSAPCALTKIRVTKRSMTRFTVQSFLTLLLLSCTTDSYDKGEGKYSLMQADFCELTVDGRYKEQPQDPIGLESAWMAKSGKYLNVGLLMKTGRISDEELPHNIGLAQDTVYTYPDGRCAASYRFLHSQNGIPQYYTNRRYVSILLPTVKPDTIHLSIQTYDGIVHKTFIVKK